MTLDEAVELGLKLETEHFRKELITVSMLSEALQILAGYIADEKVLVFGTNVGWCIEFDRAMRKRSQVWITERIDS